MRGVDWVLVLLFLLVLAVDVVAALLGLGMR